MRGGILAVAVAICIYFLKAHIPKGILGVNTNENMNFQVVRVYESGHLGGCPLPMWDDQNSTQRMLKRNHRGSSARLLGWKNMDWSPAKS